MTLAAATETTPLRRIRFRRSARVALGADALLMAASLAVCAVFFATGGLEALLFGAAGAILGARRADRGLRIQAAYAGGFAGLFVGALFAAFFHGALVAATQLIS